MPLVILTTPAHRQESRFFEDLLPLIPSSIRQAIERLPGPVTVHGDKGYDIPRCYAAIAAEGWIANIPDRYDKQATGLGTHRWTVEQTFAFINQFKRLAIRYERTERMHMAFLKLACVMICYRRLDSLF